MSDCTYVVVAGSRGLLLSRLRLLLLLFGHLLQRRQGMELGRRHCVVRHRGSYSRRSVGPLQLLSILEVRHYAVLVWFLDSSTPQGALSRSLAGEATAQKRDNKRKEAPHTQQQNSN